MSVTILQTKLFIPTPGLGQISRPNLIERLNVGSTSKLSLITAPPGFGKTSLVSSWLKDSGFPAGWYSLDEEDNEPHRFFAYLISAFQSIHSGLGESIRAELFNSQTVAIEILIPRLINEAAQLSRRSVLVLEDLHRIENRHIYQGISYLLDHLPPQLHLVITTRSDPPLPLARLRARGELNELRTDDLRFQTIETTQYLSASLSIPLSKGDILALESRTEGWIAGLQLATLSLKHVADPGAFIQAFSGSNRYIFDYLVEEVFNHQPYYVREFLLRASILKSFCSDLCDALLRLDCSVPGTPGGSSQEIPPAQIILERLERENLFLIPLDDQRGWYRYHHLFGDTLFDLLASNRKQELPHLHRCASRWYADNSRMDEAVAHAFEAGDWQLAAAHISTSSRSLVLHGEFNKLLRWVGRLPAEGRLLYPSLAAFQAWALLFSGQMDALEPLLAQMEKNSTWRQQPGFEGGLKVLKGFVLARQGLFADSLQMMKEALIHLEAGDPDPNVQLFRGVALIGLADNQRLLGRYQQAENSYKQAVQPNRQTGNLLGALGSYRSWGETLMERGRLHQAVSIFQEALDLSRSWAEEEFGSVHSLLPNASLHLRMAEIRYEWNQLDLAREQTHAAVRLLELSGGTHLTYAYYLQARMAWAGADFTGLVDCIQKLRRHSTRLSSPHDQQQAAWLIGDLLNRRIDLTTRMHLPQEGAALLLELADWVTSNTPSEPLLIPHILEPQVLVLARACLRLNRQDESIRYLTHLLDAARGEDRQRTVLECLILLSQAYQAQGQTASALEVFEEALQIGETNSFFRIFLDEGISMLPLLQEALRRNLSPGYTVRLLGEIQQWTAGEHAPVANTFLVEPLSPRELEVLALMATGLSNQQIAGTLFVALSTVKKHTSSILGKLSARNRTEAVRLAQELRLL